MDKEYTWLEQQGAYYTVDEDGLITVHGDIHICGIKYIKLEKLHKITGKLYIYGKALIEAPNLKGASFYMRDPGYYLEYLDNKNRLKVNL